MISLHETILSKIVYYRSKGLGREPTYLIVDHVSRLDLLMCLEATSSYNYEISPELPEKYLGLILAVCEGTYHVEVV